MTKFNLEHLFTLTMKTTALAAIFVFNSSAFALNVGDTATYNWSNRVVTISVKQIIGAQYIQTMAVDGVPRADEIHDMPADITPTFNNCGSVNGVRTSVTVEAGTFDVCEVNSGGQTVAVNPNVAFNIVRAKTTNGTFSLVSFLKK